MNDLPFCIPFAKRFAVARLLAVLIVIVGLAWCVAALAGDRTQQQKNQEFYKNRSKLSESRHGALLDADVKIMRSADGRDDIHINWRLDYMGPRPPLIILEPSLEHKTAGQTTAIFYAEGNDERVYEYRLESPTALRLGGEGGNFLTIERGKSATGIIKVSPAKVLAHFVSIWPKQFEVGQPPVSLHVQLLHKPYRRGGHLDAWTGELHTPVLKVPVKRW